jgi:hypothetical protein
MYTTVTTQLGITDKEVDLIESAIRDQIERLASLKDHDSTQDALSKHELILEFMKLLDKLHQHRTLLHFDLDTIVLPKKFLP